MLPALGTEGDGGRGGGLRCRRRYADGRQGARRRRWAVRHERRFAGRLAAGETRRAMGKGGGKGRGDDSSSSSDETDAKVKILYTVICLLCFLVLIFAMTVAALVYARQLSEEVTPIGVITPETEAYSTLGQAKLREFDEPQEIRVNHENFEKGLANTQIYCTSGVGVTKAEVPCQSSSIMYDDTNRYVMRKNGAYACIFKSGDLKDSEILETHYQVSHTRPRAAAPRCCPGDDAWG